MSEPTPPGSPYGLPPGRSQPPTGDPLASWPPPGHPGPAHAPYPPRTPPAPGDAAYGYAGAPAASTFPGSTAVLLLVSVLSVVAVGIVGIPSAVLAVLAWRQHARDPLGAQRRTRTGWVTYAVNLAVGALVLVPFWVWASRQ